MADTEERGSERERGMRWEREGERGMRWERRIERDEKDRLEEREFDKRQIGRGNERGDKKEGRDGKA